MSKKMSSSKNDEDRNFIISKMENQEKMCECEYCETLPKFVCLHNNHERCVCKGCKRPVVAPPGTDAFSIAQGTYNLQNFMDRSRPVDECYPEELMDDYREHSKTVRKTCRNRLKLHNQECLKIRLTENPPTTGKQPVPKASPKLMKQLYSTFLENVKETEDQTHQLDRRTDHFVQQTARINPPKRPSRASGPDEIAFLAELLKASLPKRGIKRIISECCFSTM
ncbi:hypothetical protein L596_001207 [Steinernema carpocapsae]|uniref:Uncharacterized protein n=1 Tax=Steinernema carpocapsae TaxID=34508 RepID=A0A4U8UL48_STECR|nr:hypothetical protein L596_001207 [Steinernema carpocapsae]